MSNFSSVCSCSELVTDSVVMFAEWPSDWRKWSTEHYDMRSKIRICGRILSRSLSSITNEICRPDWMIGPQFSDHMIQSSKISWPEYPKFQLKMRSHIVKWGRSFSRLFHKNALNCPNQRRYCDVKKRKQFSIFHFLTFFVSIF